jgi:hypothetical protein
MNYSLFDIGKTPLIPSYYNFGNGCVNGQNYSLSGNKWSACGKKTGILTKNNKKAVSFGKTKSVKSRGGKKVHPDVLRVIALIKDITVIKIKKTDGNKIAINKLVMKLKSKKDSVLSKKTLKLANKSLTSLFSKYKVKRTKSGKNKLSSIKKLINAMKKELLANKPEVKKSNKKVTKKKKVSSVKSKTKVRVPRRRVKKTKARKSVRNSKFGWWDNTQREYLSGQQSSMGEPYPFYNKDGWVPYSTIGKNTFGNSVPYTEGASPYPSAISSSYPFTMLN